MKLRVAIIGLILLGMLTGSVLCDATHIQWSAKLDPSDARAGESAQVIISAKLDSGWHVYSLTSPDGGPIKTTIALKLGASLKEDGKPVQPPFTKKHEEVFNLDIETYGGEVAF